MKSALYLRRKLMRIGLAASGCAKSKLSVCKNVCDTMQSKL